MVRGKRKERGSKKRPLERQELPDLTTEKGFEN